jgi:hypothetical protein
VSPLVIVEDQSIATVGFVAIISLTAMPAFGRLLTNGAVLPHLIRAGHSRMTDLQRATPGL